MSTGARRIFILAFLAGSFVQGALAAAPCAPSPTRLCLGGGRFAVEATWREAQGSVRKAQALALPGMDAGGFWFFAPDNPELAVKVLDGRPVNGFFWVFYAGLTSLPAKIAVTDTATGRLKEYDLGVFASQGDARAFRSPAAASEALDRLAFPGNLGSGPVLKADLVADFTFGPGEPKVGEPVSFTDQSTGSPDRWCWIFGDETGSGCTSEKPDAVHSYARAGTYNIRLSIGRTDGPSVLISEVVKTVTVGSSPPPPLCTFEISPKTATFGPEGGTGSVRLTTSAPDCPWTVEGAPAFVNGVTPRSGRESATITFQVERNDTGEVRTDSLTIAGLTFRILQNGMPCTFEVDPREVILTPSGQTGTVAVDAPAGCGWKASIESGSDFISHLDPVSGSGPGAVRFQVEPNRGDASRTGTLSIADTPVRVTQLAADVDFFFSPSAPGTGQAVTFFGRAKEPPAGWCWTFGDGTEPPGGCAATMSETTHTFNSPATYGVKLKVTRNDGTEAEVTKFVGVSGAPGDCAADELSPQLQSFDFGGGEGEITVTAAEDCDWTAQSKAPFVTITAGASGSGIRTLTYEVDKNESPAARTGVLRVAGRIFLVLQEGKPCVSLDPTSATVLPGGGEGTVEITAPEGCSWSAASDVPFLQVTSAASQGSGTVRYRVDANTTGASRTGRLTIGGVEFSVTQDPCLYTLTSTSAELLDTVGGIGTVQIGTQRGCPWQAVADDAFIGFTAPASGQGSGAIEYCVAANRGGARQGTIAIADGRFDVPQAGFDPALEECHPNATALCLLNGRFEIRAAFHDRFLGSSVGRLAPLSESAGSVTFFNPSNLEVLLKMIDGRGFNEHFWLFYGSLSNVGYVLTASDTETGQVHFYCNPTGTFRSVGDTSAFPPPGE